MKVISIFEDNHGFIGVATTPKVAMEWLIESQWVSIFTEMYEGNNWVSLAEKARPTHGDDWHTWVLEQFENNEEDFLESIGFQFVEETLVGNIEDLMPRGNFG